MGFHYATPTPTTNRKVKLAIPEPIAAWVDEQVATSGGTFDLVISQALEFARASQAEPEAVPARKRSSKASQEA
jgi:hypothetical protein